MAAKTYWSNCECEKLIEIVRNFPVLWKTDHCRLWETWSEIYCMKSVARQMESDRGELEFLSEFKIRWMLYTNATRHISTHTAHRCHLLAYSTAKVLHFTDMATREQVTRVGLSIWEDLREIQSWSVSSSKFQSCPYPNWGRPVSMAPATLVVPRSNGVVD